jgi:hypothetical protein
MVAIEKLIGQSIPFAEGSAVAAPPDSGEPQARERPRKGGKEDSRGRKPRRQREPRRNGPGRSSEAPSQPSPPAFAANPTTPRAPSIGRAVPPRQEPASSEPADHSHLPAFLLRPVRARV